MANIALSGHKHFFAHMNTNVGKKEQQQHHDKHKNNANQICLDS